MDARWKGNIMMLLSDTSFFRTEAIADALVAVKETESTNTLAAELVVSGQLPVLGSRKDAVAAVAADDQTAGRGRLDHMWVSVPGASFTISFVVAVPKRLVVDESVNGWLQMIAGLSALDAINDAVRDAEGRWIDLKTAPSLKWPNDIYYGGRKLGGILAQMLPLPDDQQKAGEDERYAVIFGVGLNLAVPADDLPDNATSLELIAGELPSAGKMRDLIAAYLIPSLRTRIVAFVDDPAGAASGLRDEMLHCCWTLGRRAQAHFVDGSTLEGEATALNEDASLTLTLDDGTTRIVRTADVGVL